MTLTALLLLPLVIVPAAPARSLSAAQWADGWR